MRATAKRLCTLANGERGNGMEREWNTRMVKWCSTGIGKMDDVLQTRRRRKSFLWLERRRHPKVGHTSFGLLSSLW